MMSRSCQPCSTPKYRSLRCVFPTLRRWTTAAQPTFASWGGIFLAICVRPKPIPSKAGVDLPGFDEWFEKATSRDLATRYSSAPEAARALAELTGRQSSLAKLGDFSAAERAGPMRTPGYEEKKYAPTLVVDKLTERKLDETDLGLY